MKKDFKIYTHHRHFLKLDGKKQSWPLRFLKNFWTVFFGIFYYLGLAIIKSISGINNFITKACFNIGNAIVLTISTGAKKLKQDLSITKTSFPKRLKLIATLQFSRGMFLFLLCAGAACLGLSSLHLVANGLQLKDRLVKTALLGNSYLDQAKGALTSQDLAQAQNRFALAYETFNQGQTDVAQSGQVLNTILSLLPQKKDADKLLAAAELISKAGQNFVTLDQDFQGLKISSTGITNSGRPTAELFNEVSTQLSEAQDYITRASQNINSVDLSSLPAANHETFVQLKNQLANAETAVNNLSQVFSLFKAVVIGNKSILVLFENNNELRASGGFIGTFGMIKLQDGSISKINVSSVYDLDGQLQDVIKPPKPILNVSGNWFLRDSNWFADFPQTARKVSDFYEKEGGETPDLVIALTPNIIINWLKIVGPISLPKYDVVLDADNFVEQTQVASTMSDALPTNSPKQILADLVPILLQKISGLDKTQMPLIVQSLQDNLNSKQIAIYSRDAQTQSQLQSFNWAGHLLDSDRDYLSVVSSNLGGTKTDLYVDQQTDLQSTINSDGSITNELTLTRTNKLPKLSATNNLSFIRIYVPLGSTLVSNIGFDYKSIDYPQDVNYKIDNDVYNWEKNSVTDNLTGTMIGSEGGKTFFGNWLSLNGGETKTVKLVYKLPFKLNNIDRYSLLAQKQIGSQSQKFNWTLNFPGYQIAWKNFDPDSLNTDSLVSGIILNKDYLMGMVLQKR